MNQKSYKNALDKIVLNEESKNKAKSLYDAFYSENKENVIMDIKTAKKKTKFRKRPVAMIAASMAFIMALGAFATFGIPTDKESSNSFLFTANAAEITHDNYSAAISTETGGLAISEGDNGEHSYCLEAPIKCKGNNIDSVTYTVNRGAFDVYTDNTNKIKDCNKTENQLNTPSIVENVDDKYIQCSQFTSDYNDQNENTGFQILGDSTTLSKEDQKYLANHRDELYELYDNTPVEKVKKAWDILFKDIVITATVKFNDGSTETQDIKLTTKIMKTSEAFPNDEIPQDKDTTDVFVTYTLA